MPTAVGQSIYKVWLYGEAICKITGFMQGLTVSSSVFTIAILSGDRLLAVCRPMSFRIYRAGRHAWIIVAAVWVASIGVSSPLIVVRQLDRVHLPLIEPLMFCHEIWPNQWRRRTYDITLFILLFAIPGIFIIFSYTLIGRQLWIENAALSGEFRTLPSQVVRSRQTMMILSGRRRIARMLGAIAVAFAVCWMPYQLLSLAIDFIDSAEHQSTNKILIDALPFAILLGHSNSAFNPLLYCLMNYNLHRRRRSQTPPTAQRRPVATVRGEQRRPSKSTPAAGAVDHGRHGCGSERQLEERRAAGSGDQQTDMLDQQKQVTADETTCTTRIKTSRKNLNNNNSLVYGQAIKAFVAASQLTAGSIASGYGTIPQVDGSLGSRCRRAAAVVIPAAIRVRWSTTVTDITTVAAATVTGHEIMMENINCVGSVPVLTSDRRASLGSPSSTTATTCIGDAGSSSPLTSPIHQRQQLAAGSVGCGLTDKMSMNVLLDIPTTINEESSSRGTSGGDQPNGVLRFPQPLRSSTSPPSSPGRQKD